MKAMPIHDGAFTVLVAHECKPAESERFALERVDHIEQRMRRHAGFLSSLVYLSDDATRVFELLQWARAGDWEAYRDSEDGRRAALSPPGRGPAVHGLEMVGAALPSPPGRDPPDAKLP
jgi:antibiotic biosynthesis monooxygenase (ABM) superfamily enzyme